MLNPTDKYRANFKAIDWSDLEPWKPRRRERSAARSDLPAPMFIVDTMEPVKSMLDGKMYDSKAALRSTYKDHGVVEVGNEELKPKKPDPIDESGIERALWQAAERTGL